MTVDKKADSIPTVGTACEWQPSVVAEMVGIDVAAATAPRALKHGSTEPGSGLQKLQRDDQRAAQDLEELSETRAYKAAMLMDAASMASLSKGGTTQTKAAQVYTL